MMQMTAPRIGIIGPVDLINHQPVGGLSGFLSNVLGVFRFPVRVYGLAVNRKAKRWAPVSLSANVQFVPVASVRYPSPIPMRLKALLAYSRYRSRILSDGMDLLYIHSVESALPFLFGKNRVPTVYHQHGSHNPVQLSGYRLARLKAFQFIFDKMLNLVHRRSDWTIAIDAHCREQVIRSGAGHKVSLLMNGVNTEMFRPDLQARQRMRERFLLEKKRVILFVGRLEEGKGTDNLLEALNILNAREEAYCAFFIGEGRQKKFLQDLVDKRHMEQAVSFPGAIPHHQLRDFYNMADVLLLPSEREGIPMVVLEALASGTPVVATDVGGVGNLVSDGKNGILLKTNAPESLAHAVLRIFDLPMDRESIARGAEPFGAERTVLELKKIFDKLAAPAE